MSIYCSRRKIEILWTNGGPNSGNKTIEAASNDDRLLRKDELSCKQFSSYAAKEVYSYATALQNGYEKVKKNGLLTNTSILEIQQTLEENTHFLYTTSLLYIEIADFLYMLV